MSLGGLHVVTGDFKSHRKFMADDAYGEALDNFVKGCSDMLLTDSKGKILLGKRTVFPQPGELLSLIMQGCHLFRPHALVYMPLPYMVREPSTASILHITE